MWARPGSSDRIYGAGASFSMDGCDLYDIIRCDDAFESIAVIAMSALGELPKTRTLPQVLRKPLDPERLLSAIRLVR